MIRQGILAALAALGLLAGCGDGGNPAFKAAVARIQSLGRPAPKAPTADQIRARLTPEVLAQIEGGVLIATIPAREASAALFEAGRNGPVVTYVTPDGISLSLDRGVLVATRGLGFDLMTADVDEPQAALRAGGATTGAVRIHRYLDGENQVVLRSLVCRYARAGGAVTETCRTPGATIENRYVMGAGGIDASRQWVGPETGYVRIEHIRR